MAECPELAKPSRGIITIDNQDDIALSTYERTQGTQVTVQCLQPNAYRLVGPSSLTCGPNGWVPSQVPTCQRIVATTSQPNVTVINGGDDNTIILGVVGAILSALLIAVIIILTYLLCKWWNRKSYVTKRIIYEGSQFSGNETPKYDNPSTSFTTYGKGSLAGGASAEFNRVYQGRVGLNVRRNSDASARTSSTTFSRHSMIVLPKPAYSNHYGPFWYYPIPDDQHLASSAMRSVMDYHDDVMSESTEPPPMFDPEVDYLKYPDEATAVDTMGRPVRYRPVVLGSEASGSSRNTKSNGRNGKGKATRYQRRGQKDTRDDEPEEKESVRSSKVDSSKHGDDGSGVPDAGSSKLGADNPALEPDNVDNDAAVYIDD